MILKLFRLLFRTPNLAQSAFVLNSLFSYYGCVSRIFFPTHFSPFVKIELFLRCSSLVVRFDEPKVASGHQIHRNLHDLGMKQSCTVFHQPSFLRWSKISKLILNPLSLAGLMKTFPQLYRNSSNAGWLFIFFRDLIVFPLVGSACQHTKWLSPPSVRPPLCWAGRPLQRVCRFCCCCPAVLWSSVVRPVFLRRRIVWNEMPTHNTPAIRLTQDYFDRNRPPFWSPTVSGELCPNWNERNQSTANELQINSRMVSSLANRVLKRRLCFRTSCKACFRSAKTVLNNWTHGRLALICLKLCSCWLQKRRPPRLRKARVFPRERWSLIIYLFISVHKRLRPVLPTLSRRCDAVSQG